jgi:hypothetical protein
MQVKMLLLGAADADAVQFIHGEFVFNFSHFI